MVNDNEHHQVPSDAEKHDKTATALLEVPGHHDHGARPGSPTNAPHITENVRATLSPLPAPYIGRTSTSDASARSSTDMHQKGWEIRRSMDNSRSFRRPSHEGRRSPSGVRQEKETHSRPGDQSPLSPRAGDSESATLSLEPGTESSLALQSIDDSNASASQILERSDMFQAPVLHPPGMSAPGKLNGSERHSQDTTRSTGARQLQGKPPQSSKRPGSVTPLKAAHDADDDTDNSQTQPILSGSSSALQDIAAYPLQKASGIAGFLRTRSKRMGSLLATESMGYYEKVSGMLAGGRKHYNTADGLEAGDQVHGFEDDEDAAKAAENFREHFAFPESEVLQSSFFASLQRVLPNYGKIYISGKYFCFRSLMPTSKTKVSELMCPPKNSTDEYR